MYLPTKKLALTLISDRLLINDRQNVLAVAVIANKAFACGLRYSCFCYVLVLKVNSSVTNTVSAGIP